MSELEEDSPVSLVRAADSLRVVGQLFQVYIQAVEQLLAEREALLAQLSLLREPMCRALGERQAELLALRRNQSETRIQLDNLKEEMGQVRRRLFGVTKAHMTCRISLEAGQRFLRQSAEARKELETKLQGLKRGEMAELKNRCREEVKRAIERFEGQGGRAREVLSWSRTQETCREFQSVLSEQRQGLDTYYRPKLERLMKRNKASLELLQHTKREIGELARELQPLQGQEATLNTQRKCLLRQLQLMEVKRAEDAGQHQEHKRELEEKVETLKAELASQTNKNDSIKNLKASLSEDLCVYKERLTVYGNLIHSITRNPGVLKHPAK